jgi:predicted dithiol-disulfide oxidoreductase (DUF899 family)
MKNTVVSQAEWIAAHKAFLEREKEFTRARDRLSAARRALPWIKVDKAYAFDTPQGWKTLAELFEGRSQLIVYHFMFGPDWEHGCPSCSFVSDNVSGALVHLNQRDVTFVTVSRAPLPQLEKFKKRMGWTFPWVSSFGSDFNYDFHVSFKKEDMERNSIYYNYDQMKPYPVDELQGISVFIKDSAGEIFHTYSSYARGCDILLTTYNLLDLVPKGRDEDGLAFSMAWVRHHDRYENAGPVDTEAAYSPPRALCCGG